MKSIAVIISPDGSESYEAYGPRVYDRKLATVFDNATIAEKAVLNRMGRGEPGYWDEEREACRQAKIDYERWTYRIEDA